MDDPDITPRGTPARDPRPGPSPGMKPTSTEELEARTT